MEGNVKSVVDIAKGAISERIDLEMARVLKNILDVNTKATAKRKITLTLEFVPNEDRNIVTIASVAKSTLAPTNPVTTSICVSQVGNNIEAVEMSPTLTGQISMDIDGTMEQPTKIKLIDMNM